MIYYFYAKERTVTSVIKKIWSGLIFFFVYEEGYKKFITLLQDHISGIIGFVNKVNTVRGLYMLYEINCKKNLLN
jgi:hypothetical protein